VNKKYLNMTVEKMNLINALTLVILGLWGFIDVNTPSLETGISWTALIPVFFGAILLLCHKGIKNGSKVIAHIAVVLTLLILIALVGKRLPISIENGGIGLFRVAAMSVISLLAFVSFIRSFIENRKKAS
jgi:hypothetical protein|tara:strand:- start:266 stop:655 length:390 start_codon:yes stop_codon:yes gene_type:complete